ncbi:sensor histidine kinase [Xanthobacteraceae bacterium A53D]
MPRIFVPVHFWQANLAGWLFIASLNFTARAIFFGDAGDAAARTLIFDSIGFCLTWLMHVLVGRHIRSPASVAVAIPLALVFCVVGAGIEWGVAELLRRLPGLVPQLQSTTGGPYITPLYYTLIFSGWIICYFWLSAHRTVHREQMQREEAVSMAARAELQRLRVQLDPHFLFNALNTVATETYDRPDVAHEMIRRICDYMRYSLDHQARPVCPLSEEIEAVGAYLRIQELRYDGRLTCTVQLAPEAAAFPVPHLILQGLVENAVKHSLGPAAHTPLQITVSARLDNEQLFIAVSNTGTYRPGPSPSQGGGPGSGGLGLANIRRRLQLHYPDGHRFTIGQERELVCARMMLRGPICFA